jgi:isopenicillin N synthase-like dioxygenase
MCPEELNIDVIDIAPLLDTHADPEQTELVVDRIRHATQRVGFFYVRGHGVSVELQQDLEYVAKQFFGLSREEKEKISMGKGGKAWRGFFAVGDELTSGIPDQKEGIYFGSELTADHPLPLHGANQWPEGDLGQHMRDVVLRYMTEMQNLGT